MIPEGIEGDPEEAVDDRPLILELRGITQRYGDKVILRDLDLAVREGEYVTILGPSGSGKTVLLRIIAGFEEPASGQVLIGGRNMVGVPAYRRNVGVVFQSFALFPHVNVGDNVAFGLRNGRAKKSRWEIEAKVNEALSLVGLQDLKDRRINQISGGQKQRVALARTLATDPTIVLLDEPLGALDANLRASMKVELKKLQRSLGATFLHVTGNEEEALAMADRIMVLEQGRIAQFDSPDRVFASPKSARVAFALNRFNLIRGTIVDGGFSGQGFTLSLPSGTSAPAGPGTYCIGYDRVEIEDVDAPTPEGCCSVTARHVSHEYLGAIVSYLFELPDGQHFEAQYHLHHRKAKRLVEGADYCLWWDRDQALVYPEVLD